MQLYLHTHSILKLILFMLIFLLPTALSSSSPSPSPSPHTSSQSKPEPPSSPSPAQLTAQVHHTLRTTTIYASGAAVGTTSACHLVTKHLHPRRSRGFSESVFPLARCVALGLGTGVVTAAVHARLEWGEEVWRLVGSWAEGRGLRLGF